MTASGDPDEGWPAWFLDAQHIVSAWEDQVGRMLTTHQAAALTAGIARGLQHSFERGRSERQTT